jgi:hypothetical protein
MFKHLSLLAFLGAICWMDGSATFAGAPATNAPSKTNVEQLLQNMERWKTNRIEVTGYYTSFFEYSVLTAKEGQQPTEGIWVDKFHIAPGCRERIQPPERGPVRLIGTFYFRPGYRSGHMGICSAEITQLELFEKDSRPTITNQPIKLAPPLVGERTNDLKNAPGTPNEGVHP